MTIKDRGLASVSPKKKKQIQSKGGKATAAKGSDYMRQLGRKGGLKTSKDKKHMSEIGKKGAKKRWNKK